MNIDGLVTSKLSRFGLSLAAVLVAATVMIAIRERVNSTTVALILLVIVLTSATFFGRNTALMASFVAILASITFFFRPSEHGISPSRRIWWPGLLLR